MRRRSPQPLPSETLPVGDEAVGFVMRRWWIFEDSILTLDGICLFHHDCGGFSADMRLRSQVSAVIIPGFTGQFTGYGA